MPAKIATRRSQIHGNGVFAAAPIRKGERLIEYKGRHRTHKEVDRVYAGDIETGHTFLFTLNDTYVIDANVDGNAARWINHSCDPNCEAVMVEDEDEDPARDKVFIEARRAIKPGEELSYDYRLIVDGRLSKKERAQYVCRCGKRSCRGTLLNPKR